MKYTLFGSPRAFGLSSIMTPMNARSSLPSAAAMSRKRPIARTDLPSVHRALTGLDRDCIAMCEVSPTGAVLANVPRVSTVNSAGPVTGTRRIESSDRRPVVHLEPTAASRGQGR